MPSRRSYCSIPAITAAVSVLAAFPAAADVTSRQSGHWSNPTTWQGERVPDELDHVTVSSGHEVIYDRASARVNGVTMQAGGLLRFDPMGGSNTLETDANLVVHGELEMRPSSAAEIHTLRFVEVDEGAFVGGGKDVLETDVGLWVVGDGVLDLQGTFKTSWTRLTGAAHTGDTSIFATGNLPGQTSLVPPQGWRSGDTVVIAPTEHPDVGPRSYEGFEERAIESVVDFEVALDAALSHDHPVAEGFRGSYAAEVMNLSRNVRIEGTSAGNAHIFVRSTSPQKIQYVEMSHLGVGGETSGRYALHFHHNFDGSRGSIVRGTVAKYGDNHAYVPHLSHGITFKDVVAYDFGQEPFWWDIEDETDDMVWDRAIAAKAVDESEQRYSAFLLGAGHNMTVKNSVAVGVIGGIQSGGFLWPAPVNNEPNVWDFVDNVAHNNRANGTFVWQNCPHLDVCSGPHINDGFVAYNNSGGVNDVGRGINHGAYHNSFQYYRLDMFDNGHDDIEIHARSRNKDKDEFFKPVRPDGYVNAWDDFDVETIGIVGHASAAVEPTLLIDGSVADRVKLAETYMNDGVTCNAGLFDFVRTGVEPSDFELISLCPDSVIRVQRADRTAYQYTDTNEDGVPEVEAIPAFYEGGN